MRLLTTQLAASRGDRALFKDLNFSLAAGEAALVTGPNGAGKTTLLRVLAGFARPDAGKIEMLGAPDDAGLASLLHFIGHRDGLRGALTVRENLAQAAELLGAGAVSIDSALTEAAARRLALTRLLDLPVAVLSAGQRRRTALARLLVAPRPLWLLDEPTAALDQASSILVAGLMAEHVAGGGILLAATHLPLGIDAAEIAFQPGGGVEVRGADLTMGNGP